MMSRFPPTLACICLLAHAARAAEPSRDGVEFFEKHVRPVLAEKCYSCHSAAAEKVRGGLMLDTADGLRKGGDSGPALLAGKPADSRLIKALKGDGDVKRMPPAAKDQLTPKQVAYFEQWVTMGAPDPRAGATEVGSTIDFAKAREQWSFRPVHDPPVPTPSRSRLRQSPIDAFLLADQPDARASEPRLADRRTLIRRVTFDLIGLPPTPGEVDAFLADTSADAWDRLIDRLLESPHYGEKWGRHWLDLVRYADTAGDNSDFPVPPAYRYRDYVIASFNADKPFDRFLREQIAGDLLPAATEEQRREQIVATGYLAIARRFSSNIDANHLMIEDVIDTLGKSVLGLSLGCARCHDHKYDPIPTADYYALYGIFDSTKFAFPGVEIFPFPKDYVALGSGEDVDTLRKWETELGDLAKRHDALMSERRKVYAAQASGGERPPGVRPLEEVDAEMKQVEKKQKDVSSHPPAVERAYAVGERPPHDARIQKKGDPKTLGDVVPRCWLQILGGQKVSEREGSGRRELAEWLTDPKNPLTARVFVNRVWQHHFGRGIVPTPNDFGARGEPPTHPELLDWLTSRFIEDGWSVKSLHRLILKSNAYQQSSSSPLTAMRPRRLSAEETRDALLAVSGDLDRTPGGPQPFPPQSEFRYTQHKPFVAVYPSLHRSVYLMQQRIKKHPFLETFDGADPNVTTAVRPLTTTSLQALFLMNDPFVHERAASWAARLESFASQDALRIDRAYREAFARPATPREVETGEEYLRACRAALADAGVPEGERPRAAWASYARVLLSSNEFVFL
ncbi:MAG TPA: PSD1 and planctomycete cytochrome C domain-containing protein, partial [Gemmataceae bacterium]|nr:PSD1 and planctomycete cytochrome C domain-containing protein [Gemmataceae bacterium]